ncbi:MAG: Gfo/Idh/MocA family oxidoreductase [Verrucomicrobiota bacterium]
MKSPTRRHLLKTSAASALAFQVVPSRVFGSNERPAVAGIGAGGKGQADIGGASGAGFDIVGLVDVVDVHGMPETAGRFKSMMGTRTKHPDAKFYRDYREMLDDLGDKVDAVTISTPDHHHFHAAYYAMQKGKHAFVQKPMTHSIWEARVLTDMAREKGLKTQMGNQAHANDHMRRVIELIRAGIIGEIKEVHAWTNRPIWPQGFSSPPPAEDPPPWIDWEQWIGPAPYVDYSHRIAPFSWRGWWDYGTGALGDMACHILDMPFWALEPGAPLTVEAKQQGATDLSPPINSTVTYQFANDLKFVWYDGQKGAQFDGEKWRLIPGEFNRPKKSILEGVDHTLYESVMVGTEGKLYFNRKRDIWIVNPGSRLDGFAWPEPTLPRSNGHYKEWREAIEGKIDEAASYFGLAGPLTELVLLGLIAQRHPGKPLSWDPGNLQIKNHPEFQSLIRRDYRSGWEVKV